MAKKKSRAGRKSVYESNRDEILEKVSNWARDGYTDEMIAERLGIATSTIYDWKKRYPEFAEALKRNKEIVDYNVENALLKRAFGYEATEQEEIIRPDGSTEYKTKIKHVPGDVTAQIFWLKNRKREQWSDKHQIEHSGNVNHAHSFSHLSDEELKELYEKEFDEDEQK